jgi:hypothetical protein
MRLHRLMPDEFEAMLTQNSVLDLALEWATCPLPARKLIGRFPEPVLANFRIPCRTGVNGDKRVSQD